MQYTTIYDFKNDDRGICAETFVGGVQIDQNGNTFARIELFGPYLQETGKGIRHFDQDLDQISISFKTDLWIGLGTSYVKAQKWGFTVKNLHTKKKHFMPVSDTKASADHVLGHWQKPRAMFSSTEAILI